MVDGVDEEGKAEDVGEEDEFLGFVHTSVGRVVDGAGGVVEEGEHGSR